jgi:hypothetical protein
MEIGRKGEGQPELRQVREVNGPGLEGAGDDDLPVSEDLVMGPVKRLPD